MNRQDVALTVGQLNQLGDTLLRNRMFQDQQSNRDEALRQRDRALDIQDRYNTGRVDEQRQENARRVWRDQQSLIGKWVSDGIMSPENANKMLTDAYTKLPPEAQGILEGEATVQALKAGQSMFQAPPAGAAKSGPADVETDVSAAKLEQQADELNAKAIAADNPAEREVLSDQAALLRERAKKLRTGIGRDNPADYIEETSVLERDEEGRPARTQRRKVPAGQVQPQASGKPLDQATAAAILREAGGDKEKARQIARKRGYEF